LQGRRTQARSVPAKAAPFILNRYERGLRVSPYLPGFDSSVPALPRPSHLPTLRSTLTNYLPSSFCVVSYLAPCDGSMRQPHCFPEPRNRFPPRLASHFLFVTGSLVITSFLDQFLGLFPVSAVQAYQRSLASFLLPPGMGSICPPWIIFFHFCLNKVRPFLWPPFPSPLLMPNRISSFRLGGVFPERTLPTNDRRAKLSIFSIAL